MGCPKSLYNNWKSPCGLIPAVNDSPRRWCSVLCAALQERCELAIKRPEETNKNGPEVQKTGEKKNQEPFFCLFDWLVGFCLKKWHLKRKKVSSLQLKRVASVSSSVPEDCQGGQTCCTEFLCCVPEQSETRNLLLSPLSVHPLPQRQNTKPYQVSTEHVRSVIAKS